MKLSRRGMLKAGAAGAVCAVVPTGPAAAQAAAEKDVEWRSYANDLAYTRYSPLGEIDAGNFARLEVAWRFKPDFLGASPEYNLEATPLMVGGRLYSVAGPRRDVVCLDAATGELLWMHRVDEGRRALNAPRQLSGRGVGYWSDGTAERILYVTIGYRLVSLDARTGLPDPAFGEGGIVDLKRNDDQELDLETADIGLHTAPTIANDVIVIGAAHTAGNTPKVRKNAKGYVRGFDVRTGKRLWIFHTIPLKGEFGYDTWLRPGSAEEAGNTGDWAQISADEELGLVYLGIELPTGDQMGMYHPGDSLFSESIVAVETRTGKRRWHFQLVHHGLWDYDVCAAAILCDIPHAGRTIKALALPSKQAFLYVLDRETGKPVWPIHERKVPPGNVPGEWYSPTQPFPSKPPAYDRQGTSEADLIDYTPELRRKALELVSHYKLGPLYTAPILAKPEGPWGVINLPGYIGGSNWPGAAYDPETHMVYVYSQTNPLTPGSIVPNSNRNVSEFDWVHANPSSPARTGQPQGGPAGGRSDDVRPATRGPEPRPGVLTVDGLPLFKPPYGRLTAIDLASGEIAWQVPHGETPDAVRNHPALRGVTIPRTGQAGRGAALVTKTLVIFGDVGTFTDATGRRGARLRAYDKATGAERGAIYLPAQQTGSPMTYRLGGRQYVVLAIGGQGYTEELLAFRLPATA